MTENPDPTSDLEQAHRFMHPDSRIYIAGHRGLVGSAIHRELLRRGYHNILARTHEELDLCDEVAVDAFFSAKHPDFVFLAAAKVGGILANNDYPADFIRDNLIIQTNVIEASRNARVKRLLFLGSSCIYPKLCAAANQRGIPAHRPTRAYQPTLRNCQDRGHRDVLELQPPVRHALPGGDAHQSLRPRRQLRSGELARSARADSQDGRGEGLGREGGGRLGLGHAAARAALLRRPGAGVLLPDEPRRGKRFGSLLTEDTPPLINIGTGEDVTIRQLAETVARVLGFDGKLVFDATKPDGSPQKVQDISRLHSLGWHHSTSLEEGIRRTWKAFDTAGR
jgi:GDP-L-fucose synthase